MILSICTIFLTVDKDESVKKMLLHALLIGKYSLDTSSTSFKIRSVSSTFLVISDASVFMFSNVEITLINRKKGKKIEIEIFYF